MTVLQDVRLALRLMRKNLPVTLLATGSLALAIAGNTTVYSLVNSFLNRPLPYRQVERLAFVGERSSAGASGKLSPVSPANYLDLADRQRSFGEMAAYRGRSMNLHGEGKTRQLSVGEVTPGFFRLLGTGPVRGRAFLPEEGTPGLDRVAVLSGEFWRDHFGGRDVTGQTITLGGQVYDIVGVMDPGFEWTVNPNTQVWLPLALDRGTASRQGRTLMAVGRLKDGVSQKAARQDLEGVMAQLVAEHPDANRGQGIQLLNMRDDVPEPQIRMFLKLTQGALLFVLLIACANVANLLLSRSQAREREIVLRTALGAGRGRIVAQLLTESLVMAAIAGAAGTFLGWMGIQVLARVTSTFLPSVWVPTLDVRVLAYTAVVTLCAGLLFGLAPVLQTGRFDLAGVLKSGGRGSSGSRKRRVVSNSLVVAELALALAFLAGASMMIRTFQKMQGADAGFQTESMLIMKVDLPERAYPTAEARVAALRQVRERVASVAGVRGATFSTVPPRLMYVPQAAFEVAGRPPARDDALPRAGLISAGPGYFETLGLSLQSGRGITADDEPGRPAVALVNRALAALHWPGADPVGQTIVVDGAPREIVGVVADARHDIVAQQGGSPQIYLPWAQTSASGGVWLSLSSGADPAKLAEPVRREVAAINAEISISQVQTLGAYVDRLWVGQKIFTKILSGFGILALLLAALGTYGVLAYAVAQRTQEIGIRMAIGARPSTVMKMFARQGLVLGSIGIALGIPLIFLEYKAIAAIFAGAASVSPLSTLGVIVMLVVVSLLASAIPSRRAARVDPVKAMRAD